ncbi:hypothetical protein CLV58_101165 [Spirosoma oryzae]|uniref:Uncharacterized protein n=1 Tax=Spirosoma oryzae TaxID=1469603 RepID=A0A2T0TNA5_9BACT|nr:hypothetical protein [Spirosoma oryzae]PRY47099.1 hypothetical protein CLV58_101165 [Spirosoma oryzae]
MELTHLKAAAQLAEMHHKADPTNVGKKEAFDKAQAEYDQAKAEEPAEPISAETSASSTSQEDGKATETTGASELSIEDLEEMLKAKKAEKKAADDKAKADKKAADDQAKADKDKADKDAEETKKNETQS